MGKIPLLKSEIIKYYKYRRARFSDRLYEFPDFMKGDDARKNITALISSVDDRFIWDQHIGLKEKREQERLSLLRDWLLTQVILLVLEEQHKEDENIVLYMFGSETLTSDIDISVEAPHAVMFIKAFEDMWLNTIHTPTVIWSLEFYGDFLMFLDESGEKAYLNSRGFDAFPTIILPYVGVSILRNTGTLDFANLDSFLQENEKDFSELTEIDWKTKALEKYEESMLLDYDDQRKRYYQHLTEAENTRDNHNLPIKEKSIAIFIALCQANIYRGENYILPSTVIHVVRDIQAKGKQPSNEQKECSPYEVRLATCALGRFTYLCSALEQLGYMERYREYKKKALKYETRMQDAMKHYETRTESRTRTRTRTRARTRAKTRTRTRARTRTKTRTRAKERSK